MGFLQPHGLQPTRLLCPGTFPGKNTGVGCHSLLQGIFTTQGLNSCLLHCQEDSLLHYTRSVKAVIHAKAVAATSNDSLSTDILIDILNNCLNIQEFSFKMLHIKHENFYQ